MSPLTLFRRLAVAEAITWALLLCGMFLKYVTETTELGVRLFGMAHGVVFIAYCLTTVFVSVNQRWSFGTLAIAFASGVAPFMTVWFHRRAERRGQLAGGWRLAPGRERADNPAEHAQAWMLARPLAAAGAAVVAVAALTTIALLVGPPVGSQT